MSPSRRAAIRRRAPGLARAALALLAVAPLGASAGDPLYRWSDASGTVRYATDPDRIPAAFRESAHRVEPGVDTADGEPAPPISAGKDAASPPVEEVAPRSPAPATRPDPDDATREARIAALEAAIERDQTTLEEMVSEPGGVDRMRESGELAVIAERLPRLQQELRSLRGERGAPAGSDAP